MGTCDSFENFKTSHFSVLKNYNIKYINRYIHEEHTQKNTVKNTLYFRKYKKINNAIIFGDIEV
jgi:hypothetical protein